MIKVKKCQKIVSKKFMRIIYSIRLNESLQL